MTSGLTPAEFDECFQRFADSPTSTSVFRWEAHQHYAIPADEPSLVAFREGTSRPERSVRTSQWLARIASSTIAGKSWTRTRGIIEPLSEYVQWELLAYIESQAAGEQIRVRGDCHGPEDFWVFDGDDPDDRYAIVMHYDDATGSPIKFEFIRNQARVRDLLTSAVSLFNEATPMNTYLATGREVSGAA